MKRRLRILLSRFTLVALTIIALFLAGFLVVAGAFYLLKLILEAVFVSSAEWIDLIFRARGLDHRRRDCHPHHQSQHDARGKGFVALVHRRLQRLRRRHLRRPFPTTAPRAGRGRSFWRLKRRRTSSPARRSPKRSSSRAWGAGRRCRARSIRRTSTLSSTAAPIQRTNPTGEDFFRHFLFDLQRAKKYIFLEYFIIEYGVMWGAVLDILKAKAAEGVEVRVLYDDIGSMGYCARGIL